MIEDHEVELSELLKEVRRIEVQSKRLVTGVLAGGYNSVFRGSGIEFEEVREYEPGDDPRAVDWNVTARVGRPFVKTYIDERELTVLFLVDLSSSMGGGFGFWSARQMAARICACIGLSAVESNDKVGLIAFSEAVDKYVPMGTGTAHVLRIVRDCLATPGSGDRSDLSPALQFAGSVGRRHSILFLISDFFTDGWRKALTVCAKRHDVIAVRLLSPELTPPRRGMMRVRDPESGYETVVDWSSARVRSAWAERVGSWRRVTERDLRRAQVDLMDVEIPAERDKDAIARPILKFFRMRQERGAKR